MASKRQTILDYLAGTLFPSIVAGGTYTFTVANSERGLRPMTSLTNDKFPALFVASADEDRENVSNKDFLAILHVFIVGYVSKNQSTLHIQTQLDLLLEDITKALYADPTQGNIVLWTEIKKIVTDNGDDAEHAQFSMQVAFNYERPGTAP